MAQHAIEDKLKRSLEGARCAVSGSGNVAQYASKMLIDLGAKVVSISDSDGVLVFENGMSNEDWEKTIEVSIVFIHRLVLFRFSPFAFPSLCSFSQGKTSQTDSTECSGK